MGYGSQEKCQHGELPSVYEMEYTNHSWGYIRKVRGVNMQKNTNGPIWLQFDVDMNMVIIFSVHVQIRSTKNGSVCSLVV